MAGLGTEPAAGRRVALDFAHQDINIEVQYDRSAQNPHDASAPGAVFTIRNTHRARPGFWSSLGCTLHSGQAFRLKDVREQFREALQVKQAEVAEAGMSAEHRPKPKAGHLPQVRVPRLDLESALAGVAGGSKTSRGEHYGHVMASPAGPFSPAAVHGAATDRKQRRLWLERTNEFSRDSILEPFAIPVRDKTPFKLLRKKEIAAEEEVVRGESRRISQLLHRCNVSIMKGSGTSRDPGAKERHNMLEDICEDMKQQAGKLQNIVKSSAMIDGDERFSRVPHRYDFVRANLHGTAQTRTEFRGAKLIRNSVEWTERVDSVLLKNAKKHFEVAERVEDDLLRRDTRLHAARMGEEEAQMQSAQRRWLVGMILARLNFSFFRPRFVFEHVYRDHKMRIIQRCWRRYRAKIDAQRERSVRTIRNWYARNRDTIQNAMKARAVKKIKTFILETKDVNHVMPAIYRYKHAVVCLQRQLRATCHRMAETRRKLLKQYEKTEKHILVALVRERADLARQVREAAAHGPNPAHSLKRFDSNLDSDPIDWQKVYDTGDYSKLRTPAAEKIAAITDVMRHARQVYHVERTEHSRAIKEFRAGFRQTTLFRTQMQDFLCALDQEHRLSQIDRLAEKSDLIKSLNRSLPVAPQWSDAISDPAMKMTVMRGLNMATNSQIQIKLLLASAASLPACKPAHVQEK